MRKILVAIFCAVSALTGAAAFAGTGKIGFFNETRGFGYIVEDETGKEYFVYITGLIDQVWEGDKVSFDLETGEKGLQAVNVRRIPQE